jgi:hypothetical protein
LRKPRPEQFWILERVRYSAIDGACTFAGAIDAMIEIDYQLSQVGRGHKFAKLINQSLSEVVS